MRDDREGETTDALSTEEAFALVGNEVRAAVIRVLAEARGGEGPRPELSFSTLRERVDADVRSSQFNYHLQRLVGHYVESTDDGYRLRPEGTALYRAIEGGTFRRTGTLDPTPVGLECYFCDAAVEARYEEGVFRIQCPGCSYQYLASTRVPSGTFGDETALFERIDRYDRHEMLAFDLGVCPTCASEIDTSFLPGEDGPFPGDERLAVLVHRSCSNCGNQDYVPVGKALLHHPAVISFFDDHGVDLRSVRQWELPFAMTDRATTVRSTEPWEVELELTRHEETLRVVVDESMHAEATRR